jgi:hypothetical protein
MSFKSKVDPAWEKFGIYDIMTVYQDEEEEHEYPNKFPFYINEEWHDTATGWFCKGPKYDDLQEAERRWEEHNKLVTMLREIRTYLSPPSEIEHTTYVKELLERIDEIK